LGGEKLLAAHPGRGISTKQKGGGDESRSWGILSSGEKKKKDVRRFESEKRKVVEAKENPLEKERGPSPRKGRSLRAS